MIYFLGIIVLQPENSAETSSNNSGPSRKFFLVPRFYAPDYRTISDVIRDLRHIAWQPEFFCTVTEKKMGQLRKTRTIDSKNSYDR